MIEVPTAQQLAHVEGLVPIEELLDKLLENLKATDKHERKSVVTLTYSLSWDEDHESVDLSVAVKSKRPVRKDRNEEFIGDPVTVCNFRDEEAGQQKMDD